MIVDYGKTPGVINFIFVSDEYLLSINKEYLHHDYYTDVITFNFNESQKVQGDIYISIERVEENSKEYNSSLEEEILRVIAHGILHLIGFEDENVHQKEIMRNHEDIAISMFSNL
jgi:probable rRNA maturation factor